MSYKLVIYSLPEVTWDQLLYRNLLKLKCSHNKAWKAMGVDWQVALSTSVICLMHCPTYRWQSLKTMLVIHFYLLYINLLLFFPWITLLGLFMKIVMKKQGRICESSGLGEAPQMQHLPPLKVFRVRTVRV